MESISQAGSCVAVLTKEGVVLGAEKRISSKLLDTKAVGVKRPIREVEEADTEAAAKGKAQPKHKGKAKAKGRGRRA